MLGVAAGQVRDDIATEQPGQPGSGNQEQRTETSLPASGLRISGRVAEGQPFGNARLDRPRRSPGDRTDRRVDAEVRQDGVAFGVKHVERIDIAGDEAEVVERDAGVLGAVNAAEIDDPLLVDEHPDRRRR